MLPSRQYPGAPAPNGVVSPMSMQYPGAGGPGPGGMSATNGVAPYASDYYPRRGGRGSAAIPGDVGVGDHFPVQRRQSGSQGGFGAYDVAGAPPGSPLPPSSPYEQSVAPGQMSPALPTFQDAGLGEGLPSAAGASGPSAVRQSRQSPERWQEAYLDQEQEKRQMQQELRGKTEETNDLAREAQSLREQIRKEQEHRREKTAEFTQQLEGLERENKQLQMKLMKVQMQDSAQLSDVTTVKKEVVAKTMELEKMMREFQQTHQEKLFARVWSVTSAMLSVCQKPDVPVINQTPGPTLDSLALLAVPLTGTVPSVNEAPSPQPGQASSTQAGDALGGGALLDPETQQALKRRLQSLGDVVVYANDKFEACSASGRVIPPGSLRVRPRKCDHVFLVECLMPYWAEGLCPVCRCSFAYDRPQDAGYDESDRYSSVSTSISQALPRHMGSSGSDGGSLRGPRTLKTIGETSPEPRGRSGNSLKRGGRKSRSTSQSGAAPDGKLETSERRGGGSASPMGTRGEWTAGSPARSVASLQSRASSVPRERNAAAAMQQPAAAMQQPAARRPPL